MVSFSEGLASYGHIEVSTSGDVDVKSRKRPDGTAQVLRETYCWRPGPLLSPEVHDGLSITFDVFTDGAGVRRFVPVGGHEVLIAYAVELHFPKASRSSGGHGDEVSGEGEDFVGQRLRGGECV